jgi:membrane protease YdiL (CAAX protease family)
METKLFKPVRFFAITYLVTYICWFIGAFISYQPGGEAIFVSFLIPGMMAPAIIAIWMIRSTGSTDLWKMFTKKLFNLRLIKPVSFLLILMIVPAAVVLSALISIAMGGDPSQLQFAEGFSFSIGMVPSLLVLILAATFEELGWRSYAMDSLCANRNYFIATLIFSILWAGWHFPLFFINGTYQNLIANENLLYAVNFFVSIVPMAFIISWVCRLNRGSILAAILFHFFINMSQEALNITQNTKCIETVILIIVAVIVVSLNKKMFFDKTEGILE